jgi:hypothetical protein
MEPETARGTFAGAVYQQLDCAPKNRLLMGALPRPANAANPWSCAALGADKCAPSQAFGPRCPYICQTPCPLEKRLAPACGVDPSLPNRAISKACHNGHIATQIHAITLPYSSQNPIKQS